MSERPEPEYILHLVCTGSGQHRERRIERVIWWPGGARAVGAHIFDNPNSPNDPVVAWPHLRGLAYQGHVIPPASGAAAGSGISRTSYQPRCPAIDCTRRPLIEAERFWNLLEDARRAGRRSVDVSGLD